MKKTNEKERKEVMMPLGLLSKGEKAEVLEVRGFQAAKNCACDVGSKAPCSRTCRVEDIGLRTGKTVEMLNNEGRGALLVKIDETRIAIGRGVAMKIMVRRND